MVIVQMITWTRETRDVTVLRISQQTGSNYSAPYCPENQLLRLIKDADGLCVTSHVSSSYYTLIKSKYFYSQSAHYDKIILPSIFSHLISSNNVIRENIILQLTSKYSRFYKKKLQRINDISWREGRFCSYIHCKQ